MTALFSMNEASYMIINRAPGARKIVQRKWDFPGTTLTWVESMALHMGHPTNSRSDS